jgi:hypothetical protein
MRTSMRRMLVAGLVAVLVVGSAWAGDLTWNGAGTNNLASTPGNWVGGVAPVVGDGIVLDATTNKNMTWDLNIAVGAWTQNAGYTGTVTFMTTYSGTFTNLAVSGDAVIDGGTWTHADNSTTNAYRLCVSIGGKLAVGAAGAISGDLRGYDGNQGPSESQPRDGGAHGGIGGFSYGIIDGVNKTADKVSKTYGSVRAPYALGSGGYNGSSGGGAVRLTVGGAARIDGNITVRGGDYPDHWGPGAGGSILMTASNLTGAGGLRADGGNGGYNSSGAGGRISVVLTGTNAFAATPTITAYAGTPVYTNSGAAGTIYRETTADAQGGGTVVVDNATRIGQDVVWTTLPAMRSDFGTDDLSQTAWVVRNRGKLKVLAHNLVLRALTIEGNVPLLELGTNVLIVGSLSVAGTTFDTGTYSAADINARVGSSQVSGAGYVSVGGTPAVETRGPTLGAGAADLNGALLSTGLYATAVQVFWGPTSGGTNAASWARTNTWAAPQGAGLFSTNVSPPWGTVYCRFSASNSAGRHWASEEIFSMAPIAIAASDALARKYPADAGEFTVSRPESATGTAVTVSYRIAGTASNGVDYTTLPGSVTIPIGSTNAPIAVTPKGLPWNLQDKTVRLELLTGSYQIGTDSNATVTLQAVAPPAGTNAWLGGDITQATNWSEGHAPLGTDHILLSGWVGQDMTWGAAQPAAVASWTQTRFYTNTVTLGTTYAGFSAVFTNLAVAGNLEISGGRWTHTGNSTTNAYRVSVTVGGAFTLETNAVIDVDARGYGEQYGPGSLPWVEAWGGPRDGGAHGGVGGYAGYPTNQTRTYDSVLAPWMPGSGAGGRGGTGGGAVWLAVTGPATVDGTITANGSGLLEHWGAGAGGGLYLSCASLVGTGTLRANGGNAVNQGGGGGGRIAVVLSAGDFAAAPTMSALGGTANSAKGAAGTIYREAASDGLGRGAVTVNNNGIIVSTNVVNTSLPPYKRAYDSDNLAGTAWAVTNGGCVSLTGDTRLRSLSIDSINSALWLEGHVLTLMDSLTVTGKVYSAGTYTASKLGSLVHDSVGGGQVVFIAQGVVILIR